MSLWHKRQEGGQKKEGGIQNTGGGKSRCPGLGDFQEGCARLPGFISEDSPQRCENPGDFSSRSRISDFLLLLVPLGFGHVGRALAVTFSCVVCQGLANAGAHPLPCRWSGPGCESFGRRPTLRGPRNSLLPERCCSFSGADGAGCGFLRYGHLFWRSGLQGVNKSRQLPRQDPTVNLLMFMGRFDFGWVGLILSDLASKPELICPLRAVSSQDKKPSFFFSVHPHFSCRFVFPFEVGLKISFVTETRVHVDTLKLIPLLFGSSRWLFFLEPTRYGRLAMVKPCWLEVIPRDAPLFLWVNRAI